MQFTVGIAGLPQTQWRLGGAGLSYTEGTLEQFELANKPGHSRNWPGGWRRRASTSTPPTPRCPRGRRRLDTGVPPEGVHSAIGLLCLGTLQPTDREWKALFATPIACDRRDHLALISDPGMLTRKGEQNHRNFGCHVRRFAKIRPALSSF